MSHWKHQLVFAVALLTIVIGCAPKQEAPAAEPEAKPTEEVAAVTEAAPVVAVAELGPRSDTTATGTVAFTEKNGVVTITAELGGVEPAGLHGFHVHEFGDCSSADFKSAGGHFNPTGAPHGSPDDAEHHAGDLGNIEASADGSATYVITTDMLSVSPGPNSVVGLGVILHEKADDFVTQPTGAAGSRLACGVVKLEGAEVVEDDPEAAE
jgi:Cu-Zn family superoxide dismutase